MHFKDLFSEHATAYKQFRPCYPKELFIFLDKITPRKKLALDCACGNGQATQGIAAFFEYVLGFDASLNQVHQANRRNNHVLFGVALAEKIPLATHSVDLITVAQALHWFQFEKFYREVKRLLQPDGIFAAWMFDIPSCENEHINAAILDFYENILGDRYWAPERKYIDMHYQTIPFPFREIQAPSFFIEVHWSLSRLLQYVNTWSAVKTYEKEQQENPVLAILLPKVAKFWDNNEETKYFRFPIFMRVGQV